MRVIGGIARGRPLLSPKGRTVRPTPDRVREALFNILAPRLSGCRFLDLFAGSGAVGIEALSRGAAAAVFVDSDAAHLRLVAANLERTGLGASARLLRSTTGSVWRRLAPGPSAFDIVFLDPPYGMGLVGETLVGLARHQVLAADGLVVAEHHRHDAVPATVPGVDPSLALTPVRRLEYGEVTLTFYRMSAVTPVGADADPSMG